MPRRKNIKKKKKILPRARISWLLFFIVCGVKASKVGSSDLEVIPAYKADG